MIKIANEKEYAAKMMQAIKSGNETEIQEAWEGFYQSIADSVKTDAEDLQQMVDTQVLAQRGVRQLTSQEKKFYDSLVKASKSSNPKQAFTDMVELDGGMPETIIEDVFEGLVNEHPLLAKVNYQNVKYLTKWLLNDQAEDMAVWGEINEEIAKQIEGSFKAINLEQGKLSAYVLLPKDMLDLGHAFIDRYVRTILKEALACGMEYGIVKGKGKQGEPIGLVRDIHKGVSVSEETGYPLKTKVAVKDFTPANYGKLIADNMAIRENGKVRKIAKLQLLVNPVDYLAKVMPATTMQTANGQYVHDLFPIPTEVIQTTAVDEGEAVLTVLDEYFMGIGTTKDGVIEYSDEFKFLEDKRAYKIKAHAFGRAMDNTSAVLLNIADLEPMYIMVKDVVATA